MSDPLAIPPDQIRTMGRAALDRIAAYYETLAARPILVPTTSAALRGQLANPSPRTAPLSRPCSTSCDATRHPPQPPQRPPPVLRLRLLPRDARHQHRQHDRNPR